MSTEESLPTEAVIIEDELPLWVSLCGQTAPLVCFFLFTAPYPTIRKISKSKKVGNMPLLPYSSMVVSCFVWIVYGILVHEEKVWMTNTVGATLGIYYSFQFMTVCPSTASNLPGTKSQHKTVSIGIMIFTTLSAVILPIQTAIQLIGNMAVFLGVILFASPLSSLKNVIETKSAKTIPLPFTLATCLNCFLWFIFGALEANDFNLYFPNLLGFILGLIQLGLLVIYGKGPPSQSQEMEL